MNYRKAVLYCRVSSDGQVQHGSGLEGQESACRLYAKQHNLEIVQVFQDGGAS